MGYKVLIEWISLKVLGVYFMKFKTILFIISVIFLSGYTSKMITLEYRLPEGYDVSQTALIVPAIQDEKDEPSGQKMPLSKSISNLRGPPLVGSHISIPDKFGTEGTSGVSFYRYHSIRVMPGTYRISGTCLLSIRDQGFTKDITVAAGKTYYLACVGKTPRSTKVVLLEKN